MRRIFLQLHWPKEGFERKNGLKAEKSNLIIERYVDVIINFLTKSVKYKHDPLIPPRPHPRSSSLIPSPPEVGKVTLKSNF